MMTKIWLAIIPQYIKEIIFNDYSIKIHEHIKLLMQSLNHRFDELTKTYEEKIAERELDIQFEKEFELRKDNLIVDFPNIIKRHKKEFDKIHGKKRK